MHTANKIAFLLEKQGKRNLSIYEPKAMIVQLIGFLFTLQEQGIIHLREKDPWQQTQILPIEEHSLLFSMEPMEVLDFIEGWTSKRRDTQPVQQWIDKEVKKDKDALEQYYSDLQQEKLTDPFVLGLLHGAQCFGSLFPKPTQDFHENTFESLEETERACIKSVPLLWMIRFVT